MNTEINTALTRALTEYNTKKVLEIIKYAAENKADDVQLADAMRNAIKQTLNKIKMETFSIPEFLLALESFSEGMEYLKENFPDNHVKNNRGTIIIGVIAGDVHDLGKNIVAAVLDAAGFNVIDLGTEITFNMINSAIKDNPSAVIALSSMMSTSLENMRTVINQLRIMHPGIKTLVGGASLDVNTAKNIGADGYAPDAFDATVEAERLMNMNTTGIFYNEA